jgi:iterative type I PKS product template protein
VLEEPPKRQTKGSDPRAFHVITCSAYSPSSLHQNKERLLQLLRENNNIDLANLAYTSTARRTHHALRTSYCGDSIHNIIEALAKDLNNEDQKLTSRETKTPVVFVFSGQGGLYAGMGRELFKTSSQFRGLIADLEQMCDSLGFPPFTNLIADSSTEVESFSVVQVHLSIVALQIALTELWKIWGIEPDVIMGHSIGEYAALYAAGVFSSFDALYLVGKRAQLIQSRCSVGTHAMLSISGTADEVALFLSERSFMGCEVSCFNSPGMVVLSGARAELLTLESSLKERSFKCQLLDIPYAMHSHQMDAILSEFGGILRGVQFGKPKVKIISTVLGHQVTEANLFGRDYLMKHTREPVKFQQAVSSCISQGLADTTSLWLEIGPNATCTGLLRANINVEPSNALTSLKKGQNDWKTISANLRSFYNSGKLINWREYHKDFLDSLSHIDLPKYAFDTRDFWLTYKSNDQRSDPHSSVVAEHSTPEPLSTCLHYRLEHVDSEGRESASFTTTISHPPLMEIIQGHQLCGHVICPAAVFIDMALMAAQNLSSDGDFPDRHPFLCVSDLQLDHAVVPTAETNQAIHINIQRFKKPGTEFSVSFSEQSGSSPSTVGKCVVRLRDRSAFDVECQKLTSSIQPMIARLTADSRLGVVDRLSGKLFYKLFSHLMSYSDMYKGVEAATVSNDFREIIADIRLPVHDRKRPDQRFNLSPYWTDIFGQSVGFLLNGNPDQAEDYVYIGTHIDRLDLQIENFPTDARFRVYASIESSEGPDYRGNAYILHGDIVVGISEGIRFRKMLRKNFHHLIGKVNGHETENALPKKPSTSKSSNGIALGQAAAGKITDPYNSNGHSLTLTTVFRQILLDETGLLENEVVPSAFFADVGVDSMMGISIFARLKAETGIELGASFLVENPTVGDAQRALRVIESQHSAIANGNGLKNGHEQEEQPNTRESNVVLISGRANSLSPKFLFLIADGAGSAAAYIHLPKLPDDVQIFALESPWIHDPENFTCTFNEAAAIYLAAIRRKQANGPYMLGGWSGGGVFAYEVARLLLQAGEKVSGLIIIDIPAPKYVNKAKVSVPTFEIINQLGLLAGIDRAISETSPQSLQLKNHMLSTVKCFSQLDPTPMAPGYQPDATFIIWATEMFWPEASCNGNSNPNGPNLDAWFYPSKHDFGYNGWNLLIGDKVECFQVQGDHFSIMNPPQVSSAILQFFSFGHHS